jgi:hypothetical protein
LRHDRSLARAANIISSGRTQPSAPANFGRYTKPSRGARFRMLGTTTIIEDHEKIFFTKEKTTRCHDRPAQLLATSFRALCARGERSSQSHYRRNAGHTRTCRAFRASPRSAASATPCRFTGNRQCQEPTNSRRRDRQIKWNARVECGLVARLFDHFCLLSSHSLLTAATRERRRPSSVLPVVIDARRSTRSGSGRASGHPRHRPKSIHASRQVLKRSREDRSAVLRVLCRVDVDGDDIFIAA